jgi:hypothetical protein
MRIYDIFRRSWGSGRNFDFCYGSGIKTAPDTLFFQSFYDRGGKLFSGLKGCEVPYTRQSFKLVVREEMIELICPCNREDRIMLLPKNCCGRRKTVGRSGLLLLRVGGYRIP